MTEEQLKKDKSVTLQKLAMALMFFCIWLSVGLLGSWVIVTSNKEGGMEQVKMWWLGFGSLSYFILSVTVLAYYAKFVNHENIYRDEAASALKEYPLLPHFSPLGGIGMLKAKYRALIIGLTGGYLAGGSCAALLLFDRSLEDMVYGIGIGVLMVLFSFWAYRKA